MTNKQIKKNKLMMLIGKFASVASNFFQYISDSLTVSLSCEFIEEGHVFRSVIYQLKQGVYLPQII